MAYSRSVIDDANATTNSTTVTNARTYTSTTQSDSLKMHYILNQKYRGMITNDITRYRLSTGFNNYWYRRHSLFIHWDKGKTIKRSFF